MEKDDQLDKPEEDSLIENLGIYFEGEDFAYILYLISSYATNPGSVKEKISLISQLIDKIIPDEELTRIRSARLLFAIEKLSYAIRKVLEIEDFNIILEIKHISKEYLETFESNPEKASVIATARLDELITKIKAHPSVEVKNAVNILKNIDELMDITKENRDFISIIDYSRKEGRGKLNE